MPFTKRVFWAGQGVFALWLGLANSASGANNIWVGPTSGNWNTPSNWSAGIPGASDSIFIDNGSAQNTTVRLDTSASISTLTISAGDRLTIGTTVFSQLQITGRSLVNQGILDLGAGGVQSTQLSPTGTDLTLSGGGVINLDSATFRGPGRLINLDNTIQGFGSVGVFAPGALNQGTIISNRPNTSSSIFSDPTVPFQNRGWMRATNQSFLTFTGQLGKIFDNAGGHIEASTQGVVQLDNGATIVGGILGGGDFYIQPDETGTIKNLQTSGFFQIFARSTLTLSGTITNTGQIALQPFGSDVVRLEIDGGTVTLNGNGFVTPLGTAARIGGAGTLINQGNQFQGYGTLGSNEIAIQNQAAGLIYANTNGQTLTVDPIIGTNLLNAGTLRASNGGILALSGNGGGGFTNTGTALASNGGRIVLTNGAVLTNRSGTTLTGGFWSVDGNSTIDFGSASITVNASSVRLNGASSSFAAMNTMNLNQGSFAISGLRDFVTNGSLSNQGLLSVGAGSDFAVADAFTAGAASSLALELSGTGAEQYGQLSAKGIASIDGALSVSLGNGFNPHAGDSFTIVTAASVGGTFSQTSFPTLGDGLHFQLTYSSTAVTLQVIPEPSTAFVFLPLAVCTVLGGGARARHSRCS